MIASISRGAGFRGLVTYVLDPKHEPTVIASTVLSEKPAEAAWIFRAGSRQRRADGRPDVKRPVVHISLSFAPDDRKLSQAELWVVAERFLERMRYADCQYMAVEHADRGHQHLHLVISRIRVDGSLVREELGDFYKAMEVCRQIEREHGLRQVRAQDVSGLHQATRDEFRQTIRNEQPSERMRLQSLVGNALADQPSLGEFVRRLEEQGVEVRLHRAHDGPVVGISYKLDRYAFRGSAVGSSFTWPGLLAAGVRYDPKRDQDVVLRLARWANDLVAPPSAHDQRATIRAGIDRALQQRPAFTKLVEELERQGIGVRLNVARTGYVSGIRFVAGDLTVKGSELGRDYSWARLQQRGLRYEPAAAAATAQPAEPQRIDPEAEPTQWATFERHMFLRDLVARTLRDRPTPSQFVKSLAAAGVGVRLYTDEGGAVRAITYVLPDVTVTGRDLGPNERWSRLLRRGLDYDPDRDAESVARLSERMTWAGRKLPRATDETIGLVQSVVSGLVESRPTLTNFVRAVESIGIEVRLWQDADGAIVAIGYRSAGEAGIAGADLGPGHSWQRLLNRGLDYDPARDADIVRLAGEPLPDRAWEPRVPTERERAWVREVLRDALEDRPTFTGFIERVENRDIEVRLYSDEAGRIYGIGYGLGRLNLSGHDLGHRYTWDGLQEHGLTVRSPSDRAAADRVTVTLGPTDTGFHLFLHAADMVTHAVMGASRWMAQCEELIEDPVSTLARAAARAAYSGALRTLGELLIEAGRDAQDRLAEQRGRELLASAARELERAQSARGGASERVAPVQRHERGPVPAPSDSRQPNAPRRHEYMTVETQGIRSDGAGVHAQASSGQDRRGLMVREATSNSDVARLLAEPSLAAAPDRRTAMGSADAPMPDHASTRAPGPAGALPDPVPDTTDRLGAAIDRLRAALAASRQAREQAAVSPGAVASAAGARSPVGTALSQVPGPSRIKDLSENPGKAVVATSATATSKAVPGLSPAAQTGAKTVQKQIDRIRDPGLDGPTR